MRYNVFLLFLSVLFFNSTILQAQEQFNGHLTYKLYGEDNTKNKKKDNDPLLVTVGKERMLLSSAFAVGSIKQFTQGNNGSFIATEGIEGFLIRSDEKDFVILNADKMQAVQITQSSLKMLFGFMDAFSNDDENESNDWNSIKSNDWVIEENVAEMKIMNEDASLKRFSHIDENGKKSDILVWEANNWNMNWGILSSKWMKESSEKHISNSFFSQLQRLNVPLRIEYLENGKRKMYLECIGFDKSNVENELEIPRNYEIVDIAGMIMKALMSGGK